MEVGIGITAGLLIFLFWQGVSILPFLLIMALLAAVFYTNQARGGGKSFVLAAGEKSGERPLHFDDIGGQEVAKNELREALEFIRDIESIKRLGIRPLKGILLNGPPGTGKTLLAKAAAHFTNSVFVAVSGSEFVEMYVGVGAQRVRQLFRQAKDLAQRHHKQSAVIFIDEIEVLGGKRGQASSHLEYDQTLNELLVQMDGLTFDDEVRLLVIGATNRVDMLDSALLRPGRFDRQVKVDLPDKKGRLHILQLHTINKPLADNVSLEEIAAETFGFSGAHLESVTNEAAILALRDDAREISHEHLRSAVEKVMMGEKLDRIPNPVEKNRIAIHEAGHALLSEIVQPGSVASVNIASRGRALGYVRQTQQDDLYLYTCDYLKGRIAVALAGALAEDMLLGNRSTGASSDFTHAADMAKKIIFGGMSDLGVVSADDLPKQLLHDTLTIIIKDVESYVDIILRLHEKALMPVVQTLLTKESISGVEFRNLLFPRDGKEDMAV
jgi:ATP-dependent metalloprotease FtsH